MGTYRTSSGERVKKSVIDRRVREAKRQKLELFCDDNNTNKVWCEECGENEAYAIIDCSHDISVDECQKSGRSELAWDIDNITLRCRVCHKKHDGNILKFNDKIR